ncbi:MAG: DNA polymerase III subunit delta [Solirubrobacterales bacterium]
MADLKPAYLIHGDDEVKLDAWRTRLRARALTEAPEATLEVLTDDRLTVDALVAATTAMTLGTGRIYVLADGVEKFRDADMKQLAVAIGNLSTDITVVLIASGEAKNGKGPAPATLAKAVERAGGEVHLCAASTDGRLTSWVAGRADTLGLLISREAVELLIARVGDRQRSLMRELEKLATYASDGNRIEPDDIEAVCGVNVEGRAYDLATAIIAGDRRRALQLVEQVKASGEEPMRILFPLKSKFVDTRTAWAMLEEGRTPQDVQARLRLYPSRRARDTVAEARSADGEQLERAIAELADWDYAIRGGSNLDGWTALTLAVERVTATPRASV